MLDLSILWGAAWTAQERGQLAFAGGLLDSRSGSDHRADVSDCRALCGADQSAEAGGRRYREV